MSIISIAVKHPCRVVTVRSLSELPDWLDLDTLAGFLHESLKPYEDTRGDIKKALQHIFETGCSPQGFLVLGLQPSEDRLAGAAVIHFTPWSGYVPENLLLFIAVDPSFRKRGIGRTLLETAVAHCEGAVKLHVEHDNPARRLYEQAGFTSEYAEMRLSR